MHLQDVWRQQLLKCKNRTRKAPLGFEPRISCLLDRRFDQLSHRAAFLTKIQLYRICNIFCEMQHFDRNVHDFLTKRTNLHFQTIFLYESRNFNI